MSTVLEVVVAVALVVETLGNLKMLEDKGI
jgi:hypothetical protein